jgi:hypothetical protein
MFIINKEQELFQKLVKLLKIPLHSSRFERCQKNLRPARPATE